MRLAAVLHFDLGRWMGRANQLGQGRRLLRVRALSVYEYDGERFTREAFYWDSATMLRQLGLG